MRSASERSDRRTEVLLLRHAATSWNEQHRRLGWTDHPLTPAGCRAAAEWGGRARPGVSAICSSDLERARETARIIAAELRLGEVHELPGLREQDQGVWTGLTKEQIKLRWPERLRERPRRPAGGEHPEAVLERVLGALATLALAHAGRRVLAVTHSDVIRVLERALSVSSPPVPHLEGRWLTVSADGGSWGGPGLETLSAGELTAGRARSSRAQERGRVQAWR